ncbi:MAG TPA: RNA methyltransferase [Methyloprofundus sp.]|uniref:RNA methyltransferase n=1 Tax=Methyloprofundus sp. TaxID=2020875 RepID=UPI0017DEF100|nr:RNA methyltransferase [Methyloprofundus sp.]MBT3813470.1 RNA methyltransferase [Gammaproteobacteria bacterium]HIL78022.1 RNA methyltransferase [Methylococcales bacterium]MBT5222031.1 RNA methyltransferase [Gammaproteobacteria bacterium]MBT5825691.1 RNA methyltransferase [Gammaproteobacteria bacterium]MBT6419537.1 RNA methyltransferase [Gammaproteobacteria bacterium]
MLSNIRIVLVETSHPGNIGAVARAMKNMCMSELYLVAPKIFPSADATSRASGADDILASAVCCDSLQEAIADCQIVIGASARSRTIAVPEESPRICAERLAVEAQDKKVAILFGRENSGLKNHELDLCQTLLTIPSNAAYSSLNIAAAVQVVCYELLVASSQDAVKPEVRDVALASSAQMESFYEHLYQALDEIGFINPEKSTSIMRRLRRVYHRASLDTKELDILRGILKKSTAILHQKYD